MNQARGHHYVPQLYLRRFANECEQVLVVRRNDLSQRFTSNVKNEAKERDYNRLESADPTNNPNQLEKDFGRIESAAKLAIDRMVAGAFPPNDADRETLASFIALQFLRGPEARLVAQNMSSFIGKMFCVNMTRAQAAKHIREAEGRDALPEEIEDVIEFARALSNYEVETHQNMLIHYTMSALLDLAHIAYKRPWMLLQWDQPALLTSDCPVSLWAKPQPTSYWGDGLGFGNADEVTVPLGRQHALVLHYLDGDKSLRAASRHAHRVNFQTAMNSMEKIFVHPDHASLLDGMELPPPIERGVMTPEEPFRFVRDDM